MSFRIRGLEPESFRSLFALSDADLLAQGARRYRIAVDTGFPCRISLEDVPVGERVILTNYVHLGAPHSPYRAGGPIFVREQPGTRFDAVDTVPRQLEKRLMSLRAYDEEAMMVEGLVIEGTALAEHVEALFTRRDVAFIHAHFAKQGCYAASIERA